MAWLLLLLLLLLQLAEALGSTRCTQSQVLLPVVLFRVNSRAALLQWLEILRRPCHILHQSMALSSASPFLPPWCRRAQHSCSSAPNTADADLGLHIMKAGNSNPSAAEAAETPSRHDSVVFRAIFPWQS